MFKVHFCQSLRSLREMERIIVLFLHADYAKSAEFFFFFRVHAGAGEVANFVTTRVRRAHANGYIVFVFSFRSGTPLFVQENYFPLTLKLSPFTDFRSSSFVPLRQGRRAKRRGWIIPFRSPFSPFRSIQSPSAPVPSSHP